MVYCGKEIWFIQLVTYLGEERKNENWADNQTFFKNEIRRSNVSFKCSFECPIDDMIVVNLWLETNKLIDKYEDGYVLTKDEYYNIIYCLRELKKVFPDTFINLNLKGFVNGIGNTVDLTEEEFKELYLSEVK